MLHVTHCLKSQLQEFYAVLLPGHMIEPPLPPLHDTDMPDWLGTSTIGEDCELHEDSNRAANSRQLSRLWSQAAASIAASAATRE